MRNLIKENVENLYNCYEKPLFRYAYSFLKNSYDAEDVVHDTFVKFMTTNYNYFDERHERNLLFLISRQICCNKLERSKHKKKIDMHEKSDLIDANTDFFENTVNTLVIRSIINSLPFKYRQIIHLNFYEERSPKEISNILSIPISTVYDRRERAKTMLRENCHLSKNLFCLCFHTSGEYNITLFRSEISISVMMGGPDYINNILITESSSSKVEIEHAKKSNSLQTNLNFFCCLITKVLV